MSEEQQYQNNNENIITEELLDNLKIFLQDHSIERVTRNLRRIFLDYLRHQMEFLPAGFEECISDMYDLFELLDVAEDETKDWKREL